MKKTLLIFSAILLTLSVFADEPSAKNMNVPGEVYNWQLNLGTNFVGVTYIKDVGTATNIGLPFTTTSLSAGYQLSKQIWIMAKFHLFMSMFDDDASAEFLIGPGIKAEFIRTDHISFFGGAFASIGNSGKNFLFSPEIFFGIDYFATKYLSIGISTGFGYLLIARADEKETRNIAGVDVTVTIDGFKRHCMVFMLGPNLTIYF
jgi:hypothetical protein